jgi:hypothetical protein
MKDSGVDSGALDRECTVFCRYLIGQEPNQYVKEKYRAAHQTRSLRGELTHPADDFLVKAARIGPWSTKIIDSYTRVFRPFSMVRKKLVLLLAILECCAPTHAYLDSVDSNSIPLLLVRFTHRCLTFALIVMGGILLILPAELLLRGSVKHIASWLPRHG